MMRRYLFLLSLLLLISLSYGQRQQEEGITYFINNSFDDGEGFRSMDEVYYTLMSFRYLKSMGSILPEYQDRVAAKIQEGVSFITAARNTNGGYGNWKGAISSMESTFQAVSVLGKEGMTQVQRDETLAFIDSLQTDEYGYFPLTDWDVPDVTSSYRALFVKAQLQENLSSTDLALDQYFERTYKEPLFIIGGSGYAEIPSGDAELLSSLYTLKSYEYMGQNDPHVDSVAEFVKSLQSITGGVAGKKSGLPTLGFTAGAIEYYITLYDSPRYNSSDFIPTSFVEKATQYILSNRALGSGFKTSERSSSASLSSTFFALEALSELVKRGIVEKPADLTDVVSYVLEGDDPLLGYGAYPGDTPNMAETARMLMLAKLVGTTIDPRVEDYIQSSFDLDQGGFGFRPGAAARVKYTYYGVVASRIQGLEFQHLFEVSQFLHAAQTDEGGFGQIANAKLPYLSHTYWAVNTFALLGQTDTLNSSTILSWIGGLRYPTGLYANSISSLPSVISTYRALALTETLGENVTLPPTFLQSLLRYQTSSGGFVNTLDKTVPTLEATYLASLIGYRYNLNLNWSRIDEFLDSMKNPDEGYALRPKFSSRALSTLYGTLLENMLNGVNNETRPFDALEGLKEDLLSPVISVNFIPILDNYKEVAGTFRLTGHITDSESHVSSASVETIWQNEDGSIGQEFQGEGQEDGTWIFDIGPFYKKGLVQFRVVATDNSGNTAYTDWYYFNTTGGIVSPPVENPFTNEEVLRFLVACTLLLSLIEGGLLLRTSKDLRSKEVKTTMNETPTNFNTFYILATMTLLSAIAKLYLITGSHIFANSLLIFRFMVATFVIITAKYIMGAKSYGLFAPSVLVVSMIAVGPLWGLVIFINVFALGYVVRTLIEPYNLPVGYRIGILMIFNVAYLGVLELIGETYLIPVLSGSIFIPIIITPWIADRYASQVKEYDHLHASSRLATTLIITLTAYLFMGNDYLVSFVALNPEVWVLMVFFLLKLSSIQSYSLADKSRFDRFFRKNEKPLSITVRNRNYIAKYNPSYLFPIINKFDMKMQFEKWNVPTPEVLAVMMNEADVKEFFKRVDEEKRLQNGFVIKPTQSLGGIGIIVVKQKTQEGNFIVGDQVYTAGALAQECIKIIRGEYLSSQTTTDNDIVLIEELITNSEEMRQISVGLPDIRVIVFRGIPVLAMARLPTSFSDGKANLKQGAIGAGIRISDGTIVHAEWKQHEVEVHPDTGKRIIGFKIKRWQEILAVACLTQKSSGLGYAGVDIVLGANGQISVLEINKRPGLEIQNITQQSLLKRLDLVESMEIDATDLSPIKAAKLGIELDVKILAEVVR